MVGPCSRSRSSPAPRAAPCGTVTRSGCSNPAAPATTATATTARPHWLGSDWIAAALSGAAPDSDEAQQLARRQVEWLTGIPGTPAAAHATGSNGDIKRYVTGLGEMYVADPRFSAHYGGESGAAFVRDALRIYAERHLWPDDGPAAPKLVR